MEGTACWGRQKVANNKQIKTTNEGNEIMEEGSMGIFN